MQEVKESEEWEAVRMNILEIGLQQGIQQGIQALILDNLEEGVSEARILEKLQRRFELTEEEAKQHYEECISKNKEL